MWLKCKIFIHKSYIKSRLLLRRFFTLNYRTVRQKILAVEAARRRHPDKILTPLNEQFFLVSSFKVTSPVRQDMMAVSMRQTLSQLRNSGLKVRVSDASSAEFLEANRRVFEDIPGLQVDYQPAQKRMPAAFADLLDQVKEKYCMSIFDDFPLVGLSPEYLQAACQLLEDCAGVVDMVGVWSVPSELSVDKREIILHRHKNIREELGKKLLGVVKYGDFSFAIVENFFYGFSLLNFLAPCRDYLRRLKWYMDNVSAVSPQIIEKASMWYRGPVYNYLAISLDVFYLDIDFEHTESSIRNFDPLQKEYYLAMKKGCDIVVK
jgi:hypothetical protein